MASMAILITSSELVCETLRVLPPPPAGRALCHYLHWVFLQACQRLVAVLESRTALCTAWEVFCIFYSYRYD